MKAGHKSTVLIISLLIFTLALTACTMTRRNISRSDLIWEGASGLATAANLIGTERFLDRPNTYETNPLYGTDPSDTELVAYFALSEIVCLFLDRYQVTVDLGDWGLYEVKTFSPQEKAVLNTALTIKDKDVGR